MMSGDLDIGPILDGWDYRPGRLSVRKIKGLDGRPKLQLRLDLGLLQMEVEGRPDGTEPFGEPSLLAYYLKKLARHRAEHGTDEGFHLDEEECSALRREMIQYYHRRISLLQLREYEGAARDAEHNLRIMDLIKSYALREEDRRAFDAFRPFVIVHLAQARASLLLQRGDYEGALEEVEDGIRRIEEFFSERGLEDLIPEAKELRFLRSWADRIKKVRPKEIREELERRMKEAAEREDYERAAKFRDMLRELEEGPGRVRRT